MSDADREHVIRAIRTRPVDTLAKLIAAMKDDPRWAADLDVLRCAHRRSREAIPTAAVGRRGMVRLVARG